MLKPGAPIAPAPSLKKKEKPTRTQVWRKATLIRWCLFKVRKSTPPTADSNTAIWAPNPNVVISPREEPTALPEG